MVPAKPERSELRSLLPKLAFVDVSVESKVVVVRKEGGDFAHRESEFEEILDALQIGVKLALLNGALWFSQQNALLLFCSKRFFCSQTDQIAFQFRKEREEGDDNFRTHIMLGNIQVLFQNNHPNIAGNQLIDKRDDFSSTAAQA